MVTVFNRLILILLVLLLAACAVPGQPDDAGESAAVAETDVEETAGTPIEPPQELTDFTLPSSRGEPVSLSDLQGKPTMLFFGYTFCPDVCPITLAEFKQVKANLGDQADQVNFVFVSVDGRRDTPERLAQYIESFDPAFLGLQGDEATLRKIGSDYGLYYQAHSPEGTSAQYLVDHSSASYLIDAEGKLRMVYTFDTPPEVISSDLQTMLSQGYGY
jgi:protein SCO1/2